MPHEKFMCRAFPPPHPSFHRAPRSRRPLFHVQAFLGFELGQRCYPSPVISNDAGTERIPYVPGAADVCIDENGIETTGLTYEGELNKVRGAFNTRVQGDVK